MNGQEHASELEKIDERILELFERRLEEKITQRVEATLRWRYGLVGAAFAAALVVAGVSWNRTIDSIVVGIAEETQKRIEEKIRELSRSADESKKSVDVSFAIAEQLSKQNADAVAEAKRKFAEVGQTIEAIDILQARQKDLDVRTKDLVVTVGSQPIPTLLDDVRTKLAAVGEQVDRLSQIVAKLPGASTLTAKDGSTAAKVQTDVANLVQRAGEEVRQSAYAQKMATVFIQFAGGTREQAQAFGAALRTAGYNVPPEDREGGAAQQHEVRFFNDVDADPADILAKAATKTLADLGYKGLTVKPANATNFTGVKPRPGVLELWIELPKLVQK